MSTNFPDGLMSYGVPVIPSAQDVFAAGNVQYVDGDNGTDGNLGTTPDKAVASIGQAITNIAAGGSIYVKARKIAAGGTDPVSYAETLTIPATKPGISIIGVPANLSQMRQPQLKIGAGSTAMIDVKAAGCMIYGMTLNGAGSTGGGIKLDAVASTSDAGGLVVKNCHFKNLKASGNASTGGAIYWTANGGSWYVTIEDCDFFDCRAGIVLIGTSIDSPKDVKIRRCTFYSSDSTGVDADIYLAGGSGVNGLAIDSCVFATVDVPAYATSPAAARYMDLTNCTNGIVSNCTFACVFNPAATEVTFGAAGTAAKIPTTVRFAGLYGESSSATESLLIARTA